MTKKIPLRVSLAIASDRLFRRAVNGLTAVHRGIWLGLLGSEHTDTASTAAYSRWEKYQSDDYNLSGLFDWEREVVEKHFPLDSIVLVPSAGGGREILGLEDLGYDAVGFDPAANLVETGRRLIAERAGNSTLTLSPPGRLPDGVDDSFGAILMGWGGYSHIQGRDSRTAFLSELRATLDDGAPMLISFFLRSPTDRRFQLTASLATLIRRLRRAPEPVELGDAVDATFDHYFTWDEIEAELADARFTVVSSSATPYPHIVCVAAQ